MRHALLLLVPVLFPSMSLSQRPSDLVWSESDKIKGSELSDLPKETRKNFFETHLKIVDMVREKIAKAEKVDVKDKAWMAAFQRENENSGWYKLTFDSEYVELLEKTLAKTPYTSKQFIKVVAEEIERKKSEESKKTDSKR